MRRSRFLHTCRRLTRGVGQCPIRRRPVTPFDSAGTVDTARLTTLVERRVADGVHPVAPLGSTGELAYLDEVEFEAAVDTTIAAVDGRVPVVVGVSDPTTANTTLVRSTPNGAGADVVMILSVSYWKLSEREIFQHYASFGALPAQFRSRVQQPRDKWNRYDAGVTDSYV